MSDSELPVAEQPAQAAPPTSVLPPLALAHLPGCGGRIGPEPEHFVVDEIPLYPPNGEGPHLYLRVSKRALTTPRLVKLLSQISGVRERDIGYAGLKDKHAVTSQWFSFPNLKADVVPAWELPEGVQVLETTYHQNKLRTGHQAGNRFRIELVDVPGATAEVLDPLVNALRDNGLPNYFGRQRFGRDGDSLAQAVAWASGKLRVKDRFVAKFLPSVIQAEVFNRYLMARLQLGLGNLLTGEVVRLNGSSKMFMVEDAAVELPRLQQGDIHLTGPIVGPKMKAASAQALELELSALGSLGLSSEQMARLSDGAPGTRRDLLIAPKDLSYELLAPDRVALSFALPSGSYATQVLQEFTRAAAGSAEA